MASPTAEREEDEVKQFYVETKDLLQLTKPTELIFLNGDLDKRVRCHYGKIVFTSSQKLTGICVIARKSLYESKL